MTSHREWLVDLDERKKGKIKFADDQALVAEGIGNMLIKCIDVKNALISNMLLVPEMKSSLLSMR
jgi:hypothetical protein